MLGQVVKTSWSRNDNMGSLAGVLDLSLVVFQGNSSEVASVTQFGLLEVAAFIRKKIPRRLKSL